MSAYAASAASTEPLLASETRRDWGPGLVELRDVSVVFEERNRTVEAVRGVSLSLRAGEFVSIVGPSGCGKSTLLNVIAGFTSASSGGATLDGSAICDPGPDRGVVFQNYSLFPWLTVQGNVEFGLRARGIVTRRRRELASDLLARSGLSDFARHYPDQLSGGMRQRVGIMRALANEPRVLLLDEPFGALDAQTREAMQTVLLDVWQRQRPSVLFITHDIQEAVFLSDRIYVMTARPGRIKTDVTVELERPRRRAMLESAEVIALLHEIRASLRDETLFALGAS